LLLTHPGVLDDPAFLSRYRRTLATSGDLSLWHLAHPPADLEALPRKDRAAILIASCSDKFRAHMSECEGIHGMIEGLTAAPEDPAAP
jgi:hypothetical protein